MSVSLIFINTHGTRKKTDLFCIHCYSIPVQIYANLDDISNERTNA